MGMLQAQNEGEQNPSADGKRKRGQIEIFPQIPIFVIVHYKARSLLKRKAGDFTIQIWQAEDWLHPAVMVNLLEHLRFSPEGLQFRVFFVNFDPIVLSFPPAQVHTRLAMNFTLTGNLPQSFSPAYKAQWSKHDLDCNPLINYSFIWRNFSVYENNLK